MAKFLHPDPEFSKEDKKFTKERRRI